MLVTPIHSVNLSHSISDARQFRKREVYSTDGIEYDIILEN